MSLASTILKELGTDGLSTIAGNLGVDKKGAKSAVTTAVTVLTGAMAVNASKPEGAQALDKALARDHDGSIFSNLGGLLASFGGAGDGAAILGHVLGGAQPQVQQQIAQKSGLSLDKVLPLLITIAPLVMGALGKLKKTKKLDATDVAGTLAKETKAAQKKDSNDLLGSVLDMLGGAPATSGGGLGGLLGSLGGLFKKKS
ncbi:MAG TPA: DUF937 domain-containing protein [Acidimicrobiia bacterium]|nr:DUF937 domain-containing protein [Acidimicrobiia bacterium]